MLEKTSSGREQRTLAQQPKLSPAASLRDDSNEVTLALTSTIAAAADAGHVSPSPWLASPDKPRLPMSRTAARFSAAAWACVGEKAEALVASQADGRYTDAGRQLEALVAYAAHVAHTTAKGLLRTCRVQGKTLIEQAATHRETGWVCGAVATAWKSSLVGYQERCWSTA